MIRLSEMIPQLVFIAVTSGLMTAYMLFEKYWQRRSVLRRLTGASRLSSHDANRKVVIVKQVLLSLGRSTAPRKATERKRIQRQLELGGFRSDNALELFFGIRLALCLACGLIYVAGMGISGSFSSRALMPVFFVIALGYLLPDVILRSRVANRRRQIERELPDTLDLLLICIEAGLSFDMALNRVSRELAGIAPVLAAEFGRYFAEIKSGLPRKQVLRNLARRNDVQNLTSVITVLTQSERIGTDIAEALRVYMTSMRVKRRQEAEEKGAKVSTKLTFPMIILILPALFAVILGPALIHLFERLKDGF